MTHPIRACLDALQTHRVKMVADAYYLQGDSREKQSRVQRTSAFVQALLENVNILRDSDLSALKRICRYVKRHKYELPIDLVEIILPCRRFPAGLEVSLFKLFVPLIKRFTDGSDRMRAILFFKNLPLTDLATRDHSNIVRSRTLISRGETYSSKDWAAQGNRILLRAFMQEFPIDLLRYCLSGLDLVAPEARIDAISILFSERRAGFLNRYNILSVIFKGAPRIKEVSCHYLLEQFADSLDQDYLESLALNIESYQEDFMDHPVLQVALDKLDALGFSENDSEDSLGSL